jgi:hypothetical protein
LTSRFILYFLSSLVSITIQTQPCYWRNSRELTKRDTNSVARKVKPNTTLSENLSLFQALQVIADDETAADELSNEFTADKKTSLSGADSDHICLKPIAIGALIGNVINTHFDSVGKQVN